MPEGQNPNRRFIGVLIFFMVIYLPVVLGMTVLVDKAVFLPVCGSLNGQDATDYERNDVLGVGSGPDECVYGDEGVRSLRDVVSTPLAIALDIGDFLVRFGAPFVVVGVLLKLLGDPKPDRPDADVEAGPGDNEVD